MKKIRISPSVLSADFLNLYDSIKEIENAGADEIHYDVMDGMFVPNITFGLPILDSIRAITNLKIDVHMMVEEPIRFINEFERSGADIFTIHYEACKNIEDSIRKIKKSRMEIGISIKPNTNVKLILPYLESVDRVLIMTVEPGFGGQAFNENLCRMLNIKWFWFCISSRKSISKFTFITTINCTTHKHVTFNMNSINR